MCPLLSINKAYFEEKNMIYIKNQSKWNYLIKIKKVPTLRINQPYGALHFYLPTNPCVPLKDSESP